MVLKKTDGCISELENLFHTAEKQTHCAFAAITHCFIPQWNYTMTKIDCSQDEFKGNLTKAKSKIRTQFLTKLTGRVSTEDIEKSVLELQARLGCLNIINLETDAAHKLKDSERLCKPLVEKLLSSVTYIDGVGRMQVGRMQLI